MNIVKLFGLILLACATCWVLDQLMSSTWLKNRFQHFNTPATETIIHHGPAEQPAPTLLPDSRCDGRRICSQMTSCAEAQYFLAHCPDTEMDGDVDGIPCEKQWCGRN